MYLTEEEFMGQHVALERTFSYFNSRREEIEAFYKTHPQRRFVLIGSGSSYMLAKSGQRMFGTCRDTAVSAIAGGDYMVNPSFYAEMVKDSILVVLTRSAQTTEIVRSVKDIREKYGTPVILVTAKKENDLDNDSDLKFTLDWCYDMSVSQTRTVTNLYLSVVYLAAVYGQNEGMIQGLEKAVSENEQYKKENRDALKKIAQKDWDNAVVLADGPVTGLAEEGALAFTEISLSSGKAFNVIDYRHGPIVINDRKTLTIVLVGPGDQKLQADMLEDLKKHGGTLVTVSGEKGNTFGADANIYLGEIKDFASMGIPFIFVMQCLAFEKALIRGTNPDAPVGLDAFITLR